MSKAARATVGFDVETAIYMLHQSALAAGAVRDGSWEGRNPRETAQAHLHHAGSSSCKKFPCRAGGLCHALEELTQYHAAATDPEGIIDAADETETFRKALMKAGLRYSKTIEQLSKLSDERHRLDRDLGERETTSQHELLCVAPGYVLQRVTELARTLESFEDRLRARVQSTQLQQVGTKRRADLLLTAVYQHLRWGGLRYVEIAELVPDEHGTIGAAERVRTRVRQPDARTLIPSGNLRDIPDDDAGRSEEVSPNPSSS